MADFRIPFSLDAEPALLQFHVIIRIAVAAVVVVAVTSANNRVLHQEVLLP